MTHLRPIRVMPPDLALKIAAGEVVERPASAVKELIDNSIDAGARHVRIDVREGGLKRIRVADDGHGIPAADLALAFTSHATSKVSTLADFERLTTLGFRGEALPSIATVAMVEARTRTEDEELGAEVRLAFGEVRGLDACAAPVGTQVTVSDLFANLPARRKFVRSLRAENNAISAVVMRYALAHPAVQFILTMDGQMAFHSPGTGSAVDALAAAYGAEVARAMCPVEYEDRGIRIHGLISGPALTRANRQSIHLFVNGRPVANRSMTFALEEAYSGYLMTGRHPLAVIYLDLPASEVDPNMHPSKSEVRFANERDVHGVLYRAIAETLLDARLTQSTGALAASTIGLDTAGAVATGMAAPLPLSAETVEEGVSPPPELPTGLPVLRVFGQTNQAFIIAEGPNGLYMIDQHAAHERILFDQLDEQWDKHAIASQPLLEAESVEIDAAAMEALETNSELLSRAGFDLEPFGNASCLIRAIPVLARAGNPIDLVREVLAELSALSEPGAARERALAATACRAAVKAGQTLGIDEMRQIVALLEQTPRPATCPHGRPTMIHLSHTELEREFGRR